MKIIRSIGKHPEMKPGEILIGYYNKVFFDDFVVWKTARLGFNKVEKGANIGKYPLFIQKSEPVDAGWVVR